MGIKRREFLASVGSMAGVAGLASVAMVPAAAGAAAKGGQGGVSLYKQAGAPVEAQVEDLLGRMTLDEKIAQMQCLWQKKPGVQNPDSSFSGEKAAAAYPNGMGMLGRPSDRLLGRDANVAGNSGATANRGPRETAEYVNAVQKWAVECTRLGIPVLIHEEALHGYTAREATSFPQAIGLASSFDPELVTRLFSVAAREMRARGANLALAPVVDVARDPVRHAGAAAWLKAEGYRIADVNLSFDDWAYGEAYVRCMDKGNADAIAAIAATRVGYLERVDAIIARTRALSQRVYGRMIPQVLLTHMGPWGAATLPEVLARLDAAGARYATLERVQADGAYRVPSPRAGIGMLMERRARTLASTSADSRRCRRSASSTRCAARSERGRRRTCTLPEHGPHPQSPAAGVAASSMGRSACCGERLCQLPHIDGLDEVVVEPGHLRQHPIMLLPISGQRNEYRCRRRRALPNLPGQVISGHIR